MTLDLSKIKNVHFLGIGGIGISAIARMMLQEGKKVTGQDMQDSIIVQELIKVGAEITIGQSFEKIPKDTDLIVYTTAILHYDPELLKKVQNIPSLHKILDGQKNIPIRSYPEMLGIVTEGKYTIAVSGTHGKTTTTAMIAKVLMDTGHDPSVIVGSLLKEFKTNLIVGESDLFVVEACEYEKSFLNLKPKILIINNIEADHLDYYKDLSDIESAFGEMAMQTSDFIICNFEDSSTARVLKNNKIKAKVVNYAKYLEKVPKLSVPGIHNRTNASVVLALSNILKIPEAEAENSIAQFQGTWRRLEKRGVTKAGTIVYDDYAHHPTEIKASIEALRELYRVGERKITIVFQPHLYSRTKALFNDFAKCFKGADKIILLPIYFAREEPDPSISSGKLAEAICLAGEKAIAFTDFELAESYLEDLNLGEKDVLVTMGAGMAYEVGDKLLK